MKSALSFRLACHIASEHKKDEFEKFVNKSKPICPAPGCNVKVSHMIQHVLVSFNNFGSLGNGFLFEE